MSRLHTQSIKCRKPDEIQFRWDGREGVVEPFQIVSQDDRFRACEGKYRSASNCVRRPSPLRRIGGHGETLKAYGISYRFWSDFFNIQNRAVYRISSSRLPGCLGYRIPSQPSPAARSLAKDHANLLERILQPPSLIVSSRKSQSNRYLQASFNTRLQVRPVCWSVFTS